MQGRINDETKQDIMITPHELLGYGIISFMILWWLSNIFSGE
jgi:hypothetical protein